MQHTFFCMCAALCGCLVSRFATPLLFWNHYLVFYFIFNVLTVIGEVCLASQQLLAEGVHSLRPCTAVVHSGTTRPGSEPGLCQERQVPIWTLAWNSTWLRPSGKRGHQRPAESCNRCTGPVKPLRRPNLTSNNCGHFSCFCYTYFVYLFKVMHWKKFKSQLRVHTFWVKE